MIDPPSLGIALMDGPLVKPETGTGRRHAVAIVDDDLATRDLLALRLAMVAGVSVIGQGADGADALKLARELSPDLMTLDLSMPVMGGVEAIPLLRAAAPAMRILVYTSHFDEHVLSKGNRPDAAVLKGGSLADLVAVIVGLLAEGPKDVIKVDLGVLPVQVAVDAFDSWVGLNTRVRRALQTKGDLTSELLGDVPLDSSELLCLMGVFMQFGMPMMMAAAAGSSEVHLEFLVNRETGAAARRALLALGGNGTLRAFNRAWSHKPTREAELALELVDSRLVDKLPVT